MNDHEILKQEMNPKTDLLEHYVEHLSMIQDWEKIMVWEVDKENKTATINYCYKRYKKPNKWDKCDPKKRKRCCKIGEIKKWIIEDEDKHKYFDEVDLGGHFKRKTLLENIFTSKLIPELYEEDERKYQNTRLIYAYPPHTIFPRDEEEFHELGLHYERKQINILRQMALQRRTIRETIRHGTRAAVAAIMGRNMSHNIGSHVLSYRISHLYKASVSTELLKDEALLLAYLKQRMDFIAEISTANPAWMSGMLFCRDLLIPFLQQKILLNTITLSEGIHRDKCTSSDCDSSHKLMTFKVIIDSETTLTAEYSAKYKDFYYNDIKETVLMDKNVFTDLTQITAKDKMVAIPHSMVGRHAFYSTLENFLRNSAKHGGRLLTGKALEITLSLDTKLHNDFMVLTIVDNAGNCTKQILETLDKALKEPLVDNDGRINKGSWGIKEKRISANFLRMGGPSDMYDRRGLPPKWSKETVAKDLKIIEIACEEECRKKDSEPCGHPNLSYKLYLLKPKEALVVLDKDFEEAEKKALEAVGIYTVKQDCFFDKEYITNGLPHRFLVLSCNVGSEDDALLREFKTFLPKRIISSKVKRHDALTYYEMWLEMWLKKQKLSSGLPVVVRRDNKANSGNDFDDIYMEKSVYQATDYRDKDASYIVFDSHGDCNAEYKENDKVIYYQKYRGDSAAARLISNMPGLNGEQKLRLNEIIEAGLTRVLIADERIWNNINDWGGKTEVALLERMGVCLVPVTDERVSIEEVSKSLKKVEPHFFIIHQGLIDKMDSADKGVFLEGVGEGIEYIITSGRGLPRNLPSNARFLEISTLEQLIEERDKYGLVQVLFSLRRQKDEK